MIYKGKFNLTGTDQQNKIVAEALDRIFFPWEKLTVPRTTMEIGWQDLNGGATLSRTARAHRGALEGKVEGRKWTLGVFYTHGEGIFIDNQLVNYPDIAKATVSAEIAHCVDYFLPLSDPQRNLIMACMHRGEPHEGLDTWWEVHDYNAEYFTLAGESFMQAFTVAYSDIEFGNALDFRHHITKEEAPEIRKIIGIERTDAVVTPVSPAPRPVEQYKIFGTSRIYHRPDHYRKTPGTIITDVAGYTPCKICKPDRVRS